MKKRTTTLTNTEVVDVLPAEGNALFRAVGGVDGVFDVFGGVVHPGLPREADPCIWRFYSYISFLSGPTAAVQWTSDPALHARRPCYGPKEPSR